MASDVAVEATGLTKRYADVLAVDRLDLRVRRGEVFGLLGPNGAGKTTTILMLLGLTEPTSGVARVEGMLPTREPLAVKARVGYLPDEVGFYDDLTARQNLRYTAALNRLPDGLAAERIEADAAHVARLRAVALELLSAWTVNGSLAHRYPGNLNVRRAGVNGVCLLSDVRDVAFSLGSACGSGSGKTSHVLRAMGLSEAETHASIRLGFGRYTTEAELREALGLLNEAAERQLNLAA